MSRFPTAQRRRICVVVFLIGVTAIRVVYAQDNNGITITPTVGVNELYSSNAAGGGPAQPVLVTQFAPGFDFVEQSPSSRVDLQYSSVFNHFEEGDSSDRVDQNLSGVAKITPIENYLDVDIHAYMNETGGRENSTDFAGTFVPSNDRVLLYLGSIAPHLMFRFGDTATFDAYYRLRSANTSDEGSDAGHAGSLSSNSLNQQVQVIVGTGERFGQVGAQINLNYSVGTGSGQNNQSTNNNDFVSGQYHFNHAFSVNGSIGYQKVHYDASQGASPYNSEGMTWNIGGSYTPNPFSQASASFGLQQGAYVPTVQIMYAFGPRTTFAATYLVQVMNQLQSTLENLQYLAFNQFGQEIDKRTGLPFISNNSLFGEENVLFRDKPLIVALTHQFVRSAVTISATYEERESVTGLPTRDTAIGGSIQFSRDLTPLMVLTADAGFTDHQAKGEIVGGAEHAQIINADITLTYKLSETANFSIRESFVRKNSNVLQSGFSTEQVLVGLSKEF